MENKQNLAKRLGRKIKEIRNDYGLSQKKLSEDTGLSISLISRIENGLAMPSIATLQSISYSLKVDIGYFFKGEEPRQFVISPKTGRRTTVSGKGYDNIEILIEGMATAFMEPSIVTMAGRDQDHKIKPSVHDGQEFMYVLEGKIELTLGNKKYNLEKGDAAYWNGNIPHKGISLSKRPSKSLNVHFIPGKRVGALNTKD